MAKYYEVTVPIAGHAFLSVLADSEEEAIEKAVNEATLDQLDTWEALKMFHEGNICYCPRPWEAEAECDDDEEDK